ncbi:MAG TPA: alcohol dehydrogenase catalytic domain-containing protein [Acidimicrobiia bacterium]|nr:alcohol dehydrogenase catalytic domain-containing protein [Acidimicrobiia bacterium]
MKAIQLEEGELHVRDVAEPQPGADEARVRLRASGVCHSDLHLARGDWMGVPRSMSLGHEGIGVVEALGPGAERFVTVGDRVILGLGGMGGGYWCGACDYCLSGRPRLCAQARPLMGTFAEQLCVWAPALVPVPDALGDEEAPLACGGLTAFSAVRKLVAHGIAPGRTIAVIGAAGGLGHYAVQIAQAFGYRVVGVDVGEERLEFVRALGAEHAVSAALVFAARLAGFDLGLQMLRRGGLFVAVGIPASSEGNLQLHPWQLFLTDPTIIYSAVGTVQEMRELVDLAAAGKVKTHVSRVGSLSDVPAIFDELEAGKYLGRAVITDLTR